MQQKFSLLQTVWEQRRGQVICVGALLLVICALGAVHGWSVAPRLSALQDEQLRLQKEVRERQLEFARSGVPVSTAEQLKSNLQRFQELIPAINQFSLFVGELFSWADQSGLMIHQISYRPEADEAIGDIRYGLSFSVDGDYGDVKKFLYLLENTDRILIIENISLSGREGAGRGEDTVSLRIQLATYFREEAT